MNESDRIFKEDPLELLEMFINTIPEGNTSKGATSHGIELQTKKGIAFSAGLLKVPAIAVANTVLSDGARLESHFHEEREIIIVYQGMLKVWKGTGDKFDSNSFTLVKCQKVIIIEPNVPHQAEAVGDTRIIAITMPASKHFPDARAT